MSNLKNYGYTTWYGWRCKNWGTKWNSCETYVSEDCLSFWTAWSAPIPIMLKLSERFPEVVFEMKSEYEGGKESDVFLFKNGEIIE